MVSYLEQSKMQKDFLYIQQDKYNSACDWWQRTPHSKRMLRDMGLYIFDLYKLSWKDIRYWLRIQDDNLVVYQCMLADTSTKEWIHELCIQHLIHKVRGCTDLLVVQEEVQLSHNEKKHVT